METQALLFTSNNSRYCSLALRSEIGESFRDASYFLGATFGVALLLLDVPVACCSGRSDIGQPCLARIGKVCDMLLEAGSNTTASRFDAGAERGRVARESCLEAASLCGSAALRFNLRRNG